MLYIGKLTLCFHYYLSSDCGNLRPEKQYIIVVQEKKKLRNGVFVWSRIFNGTHLSIGKRERRIERGRDREMEE